VLALDEGRLDDAAVHAASATASALAEDQPGTAMAWFHGLEGIIAFQDGDLAAAEASWRLALTAWNGSPHAHAGLGQTLVARGDLRGGRLELERSLAIRALPEALASLADVQDRLGDAEAAAATRAALAELPPAGQSISAP
jgi:predicted Zn-dependent protease